MVPAAAETALIDTDSVNAFFRDVMAKEWGARVDSTMRALQMKESTLARLAGTSPQTISKIRNGQVLPRESLRVAVAVALLAEPGQLFPMPNKARILAAIGAGAP